MLIQIKHISMFKETDKKALSHQAFGFTGLPLATLVLSLTLPFATFAPSAAMAEQPGSVPPPVRVAVQNFPEVQATQTTSRPFVMTGLADFTTNPDYLVSAGSFSVPPGLTLVLDGASADLHGVIANTTRMAKVRLRITFPNQPPLTHIVNVATDFKPVTVDLGGAYTSTPVSWALPPMQLPPGTEVQVSVLQNASTNSPDYGVLVTGHLVRTIADE